MNYKLKTSTNKDTLTVTVTLPKIKEGERAIKVDAAKVINDLKSAHDIITCTEKRTLISSTQEEVKGDLVFKIKYTPPRKKSTRKKESSGDSKKEDS